MPYEITTKLGEPDSAELARVKMAAFENTNSGRLRFAYNEHYDLIEKWATDVEMLEFASNRRQRVVAIVDTENRTETGARKILAMAKWLAPTKAIAPIAAGSQSDEKLKEAERDLKQLLNDPERLPPGTNMKLSTDFRASLVEGKRKYFDEEKDWYLDVLCTDPKFVGQGHATRLVRWGMEQADAANARIYLEATPEGAVIYKRYGWKTLEQIGWKTVDYGIDDAGDDNSGIIKMFLMMREPATAN